MNYPQVNIDTAGAELNRLHSEIEDKLRSTVQDAIRAGEILTQIKGRLRHGDFLPWIKANCHFSERTARNYIGIYDYRSKTATLADLQTAYAQVETLEAQARKSEEEQARHRVGVFLKSGQKPEGWRRGTDDKLAQEIRDREERIKKFQEEIKEKTDERIRQSEERATRADLDMDALFRLAEEGTKHIAKRQAFKENIRISHEGKDDPFVDAIMDYLESLDDDNRRVEACYNIIKVCKRISLDIQATQGALV